LVFAFGLERLIVTARRRGVQAPGRSASGARPGEGDATPASADEDRRVRYTLDLSREQHRFLKRFAFDAETDASLVMRALLALLETDETVARKLRSKLKGEAQSR
jgi:hypothetical protein